ncbi:hypothetical protein EDD21DRAFT_375028 [Dissophora ornata]|nr:hypothetical protein EDD21DRAFT_375028 [Dissophora ornata]
MERHRFFFLFLSSLLPVRAFTFLNSSPETLTHFSFSLPLPTHALSPLSPTLSTSAAAFNLLRLISSLPHRHIQIQTSLRRSSPSSP